MTPHRPGLLRACALVALGFLAALPACSSTGGSLDAVGTPARIRFVSGRSLQTFELVNETHTGRVELYSATRENADTKVQEDEVVDEVLDYFKNLGLFERTQPGVAPPAGGAYSSTLEIDVAGNPVHFAIGQGSSTEDRTLFAQCLSAFLVIYNETYQLQSVERHPEWSPSVPTSR